MKQTVAVRLAHLVQARLNCLSREPVNQEWADRHEERAEALVEEFMPSGSGFDSGTVLDFDKSTGEKLVFTTAFHHMAESGMYDGWTNHEVTVRPSFVHGFEIKVSGRDRNQIKAYIGETFHHALGREAPEETPGAE